MSDDHVIYLYASPEELSPPTIEHFLQERQKTTSRQGTPPKLYWYGFIGLG